MPELAERFGSRPLAVAADPDTERHRLHGAVGDLLAEAGRSVPVVLVIEDGHWADAPTLLLLCHLARGAAEARALVVTTFRDTEAEVPETLAAARSASLSPDCAIAARSNSGPATAASSRSVDVAVLSRASRWPTTSLTPSGLPSSASALAKRGPPS